MFRRLWSLLIHLFIGYPPTGCLRPQAQIKLAQLVSKKTFCAFPDLTMHLFGMFNVGLAAACHALRS
jgi:hypothetical protein